MYKIDREIDEYDELYTKSYIIKLCWGCGYFMIHPNIIDEFTISIMNNRFMIIELIESNELIPIL
jgi:hypothetical protein